MSTGKFITFEGGEGAGKTTQAELRPRGHIRQVVRDDGIAPDVCRAFGSC